jgi:hypothetical protein
LHFQMEEMLIEGVGHEVPALSFGDFDRRKCLTFRIVTFSSTSTGLGHSV